jgi:hypothetical protein
MYRRVLAGYEKRLGLDHVRCRALRRTLSSLERYRVPLDEGKWPNLNAYFLSQSIQTLVFLYARGISELYEIEKRDTEA